MRFNTSVGVVAVAIAVFAAPPAAAQNMFDVHASMAIATKSHAKAWGGGLASQHTIGSSAPVKLSLSPGYDFLKPEDDGSAQHSFSVDANVQPGGSGTVTPYAGGSVSANFMKGSKAKPGYDTMAGVQVKLGKTLSAKAEERFGYVQGSEHTLTTRLGLLITL